MTEPLLRPGWCLDKDQKIRLAGLLMTRGEVNGVRLVGVVTVHTGMLWWRKPAGYSAYIQYQGQDHFSEGPCPYPLEAIVEAIRDAEYPHRVSYE